MNTRKVILGILAVLLVLGIGNFIVENVQTRSQLGLIGSKDATQQVNGVNALMDRGRLFDALQGGVKPEVRIAAIETLSRMAEGGKNEKAFNELLQMLKDPDTESAEKKTHPVRDKARDEVARVGVDYPDKLLEACKNPDKNIQDQSREALKKIGAPLKEKMATKLDDGGLRAPIGDILASIGPETVPLIAPFLSQTALDKFKDKPDDLRNAKIQLIEIMGKFKVPEAAIPIIPFKDDPHPNVRRAVITSLANIADPVGAPVLISSLGDRNTDSTARAAAAVALGSIATPEANTAMLKAVSDYDRTVATAAAAGLRRAGDKAAPYIAQLLASSDVAVRAFGAEASGGMRTVGLAVKALSDTDPSVRAEAVESLGDILVRANGIRADLARLASATDVAEQEKAFRSLQTRGAILEMLRPGAPATAKTNALAMLNARSADAKDDAARKPFQDTIAKLTNPATIAMEAKAAPLVDGGSPAALVPLVSALRDKSGNMASNAAAALGRLGTAAVPTLVGLLGDPDDTVAYYASQALVTIARPAVDSLLPLAQDGKPGARWAAVTLGEIGDSRATATLETLSKSSDADTAYAASTALAKVRAI